MQPGSPHWFHHREGFEKKQRGCYCERKQKKSRRRPSHVNHSILDRRNSCKCRHQPDRRGGARSSQQAMRKAIQQAMRAAEEQRKTCLHYGSEALRSEGTDRRVVLTKCGRVVLALRRMRCQACRPRFRPADDCLVSLQGGNLRLPGLKARRFWFGFHSHHPAVDPGGRSARLLSQRVRTVEARDRGERETASPSARSYSGFRLTPSSGRRSPWGAKPEKSKACLRVEWFPTFPSYSSWLEHMYHSKRYM
jgi:hypothetical protein